MLFYKVSKLETRTTNPTTVLATDPTTVLVIGWNLQNENITEEIEIPTGTLDINSYVFAVLQERLDAHFPNTDPIPTNHELPAGTTIQYVPNIQRSNASYAHIGKLGTILTKFNPRNSNSISWAKLEDPSDTIMSYFYNLRVYIPKMPASPIPLELDTLYGGK